MGETKTSDYCDRVAFRNYSEEIVRILGILDSEDEQFFKYKTNTRLITIPKTRILQIEQTKIPFQKEVKK